MWCINVSDLEDAHRCVEKELFPVFACLGACEQRAFEPLCSSFDHISESIVLNISMFRIRKMFTNVLKTAEFHDPPERPEKSA